MGFAVELEYFSTAYLASASRVHFAGGAASESGGLAEQQQSDTLSKYSQYLG